VVIGFFTFNLSFMSNQNMSNENLPKVTISAEAVGAHVSAVSGVGSAVSEGAVSESGGNIYRVDVSVLNVPADLFGVAFHLKIRGAEWNLVRYEGGNAFALSKENPLILASEKVIGEEKEIIFGAVKMAQDKSKVGDGALVSFYINVSGSQDAVVGKGSNMIDFKFSDTHLTVVDGARRDVSAVWEDGDFVLSGKVGAESESLSGGDLGGVAQFQASVIAKNDDVGFDSLPSIYLFLGVSFVILSVVYLVCCLFMRRRRVCAGVPEGTVVINKPNA
jgi:hypothetical protein